ncbi:PREDICTED: uncharacterized protein LOC109153610 [Ipomoea nil]|uniref:uncharacterized protein LOC109153610 n=1 Tax=Ipomoea nil TaxID=35883 RepID=UPI000900EF95|nr:PREDICTED: uncharacterized protein LOC109153610 [Ipomoea nil]
MARRTIKGIIKKLDAGYEGQFKRLRDYAQECLNSNPGSTVKIETNKVVQDAPCVFQRIYVCFAAVKKGFVEGCRKVIELDGCFLKGMLKGEILTAVGRDRNNQMYPIAWAVVEIENNSSWRWFLDLLKGDLGMWDTTDWTIMSDQQKGLSTIIAELFPGIEHRNCARHVHANWSKSHRGKVMKKLFWTEVKCDIVDKNLSEAFNNTLLKARSKPIVSMLEDIRVGVMKRIAAKKYLVEKWNGQFGSFIMKKLNDNIVESVGWEVDFNGDDGYEIKKGKHQYKILGSH